MKKYLRSLVASVLAVLMILSLAACGGGNDPSGGGTSGGTSKPGKENVSDFVYVPSFKEFVDKDNIAIDPVLFTEEGFYTTGSDIVGRRELEEGEELYDESQLDIYAESISFTTYDGVKTKLSGYTPFTKEFEEGHDGATELSMLAVDENGNFAALYHVWDNWNDVPEGVTTDSDTYWDYFHYDEEWYLRTMDPNGAEKSVAKITPNGEWFYPYGLVYSEGKILVVSNNGLEYLGEDGSFTGGVNLNGYVQNVFKLKDGASCVSYWDNVKEEQRIALLDAGTGRVTQTWSGPRNANEFISGAGDYDLYYYSGINIYGYDLENETSTKLFDWLNLDVARSELAGFTVRSDGSFFAVTNSRDVNWEYKSSEFVTVTRKPAADVEQKQEITLACQYTDSVLENAVIKFNRNSDVRIRVIDYSQYNNENDWNAGLTKLTTEIMAGNMPDILALEGMPYKQLAAKGLIEDLYPYIDADSEIKREDLMPNVLAALEVGGKLCTTATTFWIQTLAGASKIVGNDPGWTFDELTAALKTMDEGCTVLDQNTTSGDILRKCVTLDIDNYIDWSTGECRFDSQEFIDLLNFAKLFPNSFDWGSIDWEEFEDTTTRIAAGKQMLMEMSMGDFGSIVYHESDFGGDLTYIGYPCSSGSGSFLNIGAGYAMSAKCANKDAAWQFLRGFLTPKGLENYGDYFGGFPVNRTLLEAKLKDAMTVEYEKDENGEFIRDEKGEKVPMAKYFIWSDDSEEPEYVYSLSQEQADKVMELINSTTRLFDQNTAILDIICEQADAFFAGEKTAEETARLIQGKLSIYVNEQR